MHHVCPGIMGAFAVIWVDGVVIGTSPGIGVGLVMGIGFGLVDDGSVVTGVGLGLAGLKGVSKVGFEEGTVTIVGVGVYARKFDVLVVG